MGTVMMNDRTEGEGTMANAERAFEHDTAVVAHRLADAVDAEFRRLIQAGLTTDEAYRSITNAVKLILVHEEDYPAIFKHGVSLPYVGIRATYPCCPIRWVYFQALESVPREVYDIACRICKTKWTVTRTTLREGVECRPGVKRIDKLEWEVR